MENTATFKNSVSLPYFWVEVFTMCLKSLTALFACGFWLTIPTLIIGFGGFSGIGMGMMLVSCVAALNQHFDKKKALANSIMMCGAPLGYFLSAPVLIHLLETKGLEVTFFFQGENQFHSTVCGSYQRQTGLD